MCSKLFYFVEGMCLFCLQTPEDRNSGFEAHMGLDARNPGFGDSNSETQTSLFSYRDLLEY